MKVKDIIIYPVKSIGGISLKRAKCTALGFEHDRRMMLADADGKFVSQREIPRMATIGAKVEEDGFLFYDKLNTANCVKVLFKQELGEDREVSVWKHTFTARRVLGEAEKWFQDILGADVYLHKMDSNSDRNKSLIKSPGTTKLSMADGYPYLLLSVASLNDLNSRLEVPVTIDRFRPNIIFEESEAFEEELLDRVKVGEVDFRAIKPCARCTIITINQKTSEKLVEPLKTLSLYKKKGNKVYFGMNAVSLSDGEIKVGDVISKI